MDSKSGFFFLNYVLLADKATGNDWRYCYTAISPRILLTSLSKSLHSLPHRSFLLNHPEIKCSLQQYTGHVLSDFLNFTY